MKTIPPHYPEQNAPLTAGMTLFWHTTPTHLRALADQMEQDWADAQEDDEFSEQGTHIIATFRNGPNSMALCVDVNRIKQRKAAPKTKFQARTRNGHVTTPASPEACAMCKKPIARWGRTCTGMPDKKANRYLSGR